MYNISITNFYFIVKNNFTVLIRTFLLVLTVCFLFLTCKPEPIQITEAIHCENITTDGACIEKGSKQQLYTYTFKDKKINNWENFASYIYFKTKETPGIFVKFNRKLTISEKQLFKNSLKAYYEFADTRGKLEGIYTGEDWFFVFHYLGDLIKDHTKEIGEVNSSLKPDKIFPVQLKFFIESELFKPLEIEQTIDIKLEYEKG